MSQALLSNGVNGAPGLHVPQLVDRGRKLGLEHAVNQLLGATISVPGIQRRLETVYQLSVQVSQVSIITYDF